MVRPGFGSFISTLGLVALSTQPADARVRSPVFITRGAPIEPPRGFLAMCQRDSSLCAIPDVATDPINHRTAKPMASSPARSLELSNRMAPSSASRSSPCLLVSFDPEKVAKGETLTAPPCAVPAAATGEAPAPTMLSQMPTAGLIAKSERVAERPGSKMRRASPKPDGSRHKAALLKEVNALVNSRVRQRPDIDIYGKSEHWARSGIDAQATGDCEDLAIEKRHQLLARGFDAAQVSFAVVFSAATGLHTILVVRTEDGDMVLDSATPWVRRADQTGYSWISIQSAGDQMSWVSAGV